MKKAALILALIFALTAFAYADVIDIGDLEDDVVLTETDTDSDTETEADTATDTEADSETDSDSDTESDVDTEEASDTDTASDTDADSETDSDSATDSDSDSDTDSDTDKASDTDKDSDSDSDVLSAISVTGVLKTYTKGDSFDESGSIILKYKSGKSEVIDLKESHVKDFSTSTVGTHTVTVKYGGLQCTYDITVKSATTGLTQADIIRMENMMNGDAEEKPESTKTNFVDVFTTDWYYSAVKFVNDNKLMSGMSANEFSPNYNITRGMLITILHRNEGLPASGASVFADVADGEWYSKAVMWGYESKIVSGMTEKTFEPMANLTREQLAVMLYNYAEYKKQDTALLGDLSKFSDASVVSDWAENGIKWATGKSIITGRTDGTLDPKGYATRAEVATILMRFLQK